MKTIAIANQKAKMPTNTQKTKGVSKALANTLGFFSLLFGLLILLGIVFELIGSIFMFISTNKLFQLRRVKKEEDNTHSESEGRGK